MTTQVPYPLNSRALDHFKRFEQEQPDAILAGGGFEARFSEYLGQHDPEHRAAIMERIKSPL